uniref:Uncharacterized protein n=1 Tax=Bursaphelenchus xylophilus TaxID=6326 RepID=A0A1I7S6N9_BURXY
MDRDVERSFAALQLQEDPGPRRRPVPMRSRIRRLSDVLREPHANGDDAAARHSQRRPSGQFNGIRDNGQTQSGSNQLQLQVYQNPARNQQSSSQHALNNINSINNTHNERQGRRRSKRTSIILIEHGGSGSQSPNPVDILPAVYKIQQPQAPQPHAPQVQNPQLQNLPVRFVTAPPPQQPVVPISENLQLAPIGFNQETVIHHPPPNFFYPQHLQPMEPQFYQQPFIDFAPVNGIFDNSGHFIPQPFIVNGANGIMPIQREVLTKIMELMMYMHAFNGSTLTIEIKVLTKIMELMMYMQI